MYSFSSQDHQRELMTQDNALPEESEYLLEYISLALDLGDEESALGVWLGAVDTFIEESRFADAERLLQHIRRHKLSARAKAQVELVRAEWHEKRGDNNSAVRAYQQSIAGFRGLGDANAEALASNSLALLLKEMGRYNEATLHYRVAARLYRRLGDEESYGEVLANQGGIADAQRDWASAIPYYEKAIRAFTRVSAKKKLAGAYNNLGLAHEMLDKLEQAETWYLKCVDLLDEIGESYSEQGWRILSNLGQLNAKRKKWDKAVGCNQSSLEVANKLDSNWHRAMSWNNLGTLWEERGDKRQAADCFREALRFQVETTDRFAQATVLNNLASVLSDLADFAQAENYYRESLALSRESEDASGEARTLNNLAVLLQTLERMDEAMGLYRQAADLFQQLGDVPREVSTLTNLIRLSWKMRREEPGRAAFLRAWVLARQRNSQEQLAKLYELRGDWIVLEQRNNALAQRWYLCAVSTTRDESLRREVTEKLSSNT